MGINQPYEGMGVQEQQTVQTESHNAPADQIDLLDGETIIESAQPSLWNWWKWMAVAFGAVLFGIEAVSVGELSTTGVVFGIAVATGGYAYFARQQSRYVVTDQRVVKNVGLVRRGSSDVRIADIRSVSTSRSIRQRLALTGTVEVVSVGGDSAVTMQNFRGYNDVARAIRMQQQTVEQQVGPGDVSVTVEDDRYE
jgi:hypothetical protein